MIIIPVYQIQHPGASNDNTQITTPLIELQEIGVPVNELLSSNPIADLPLPFSGFIQNIGQISGDTIAFYFSGSGFSFGFGASQITVVSSPPEVEVGDSETFFITFPDSNRINPVGVDQKSHVTNYFYGDLQFTNVASWDEVWYYDLYPGIDLRYYMAEKGLKYDFIVHPGANPELISLKTSDSVKLIIEDQSVSIQSIINPERIYLKDVGLEVFQADGQQINARFIPGLNEKSYGYDIPSYDQTQDLIIDPYWLDFSTFLGGSSGDTGIGIAVDTAGNSYVTGETISINFPTTAGAFNQTYAGGTNTTNAGDVFIAKLNATGTGLVFSTFIGGSSVDTVNGIAVDTAGNSYVTGSTSSSNFPTTAGAYNQTHSGTSDAFIVKLNATGTGLVFSTFVGGSSSDGGSGIAVDTAGNSYVTGTTWSSNFPTTAGAYNQTHGGNSDAFVVKLNATGTGLVFSTFVGGSSSDRGSGIVVDTAGNSYVTGSTWSSNFPTTAGAFNQIYSGGMYTDVSTAIPLPLSLPLPPRNVLNTSSVPVAFNLAINISLSPL